MKIDLEKLKEVSNKYYYNKICYNTLQYMVDTILQNGEPGRMDLSSEYNTPELISFETLKELGIVKD